MYESINNTTDFEAFTVLSHAERDQVLFLTQDSTRRSRLTAEHIRYLIDEINNTREPNFIDNLFHSIFRAIKEEQDHRSKNLNQIKKILHLIPKTPRLIAARRRMNLQLSKQTKSRTTFPNLESVRNFHGRMRMKGIHGFIVPHVDNGAYTWVRVDLCAPVA